MLGSHLSIAGGLYNALIEAQSLQMDCVQIFTKNQRQWNVPPLTDEHIREWNQHRKATGIDSVVSHDSYLINLASAKPETREKSIDLFHHELTRCEALSIPWLVTHPGAHLGQGEDAGLALVAQALNDLHKQLPGLKVVTCLEITAGQGTCLGAKLEHLAKIIELTDEPDRLGVCLDTAHLLAAGYDLTSKAGAQGVLDEFDRVLGSRDHLKVWHINDSMVPLGSRKDRHAHIGQGHVSLDAFEVILNDPKHQKLPMILETAKGDSPDGRAWDEVNLESLKKLCHMADGKKPKTSKPKASKK